MGALIASLMSLAPVIIGPTIKAVEAIFGPKTGDTKMTAVVEALTPVMAKMAAAGKLPGIPDEQTLRGVIEIIFQATKRDIENPALVVSAPETSSKLIIPPGAIVTITYPAEVKK